jgi:asparagine synthetase B (glutamine-hydrolysing)
MLEDKLKVQLRPFPEKASHSLDWRRTRSAASQLEFLLQQSLLTICTSGQLGVLLSSGIDSALIVAVARTANISVDKAFTIAFSPDFGINEDAGAMETAYALGVPHHTVNFSVSDAIQYLDTLLGEETPVASWTALPHRRLLDYAAEHGCDSLLSGLGADEIFCGYESMGDYFFSVMHSVLAAGENEACWPDFIRPQDFGRAFFSGRFHPPYTGMAHFCDVQHFKSHIQGEETPRLVHAWHYDFMLRYLSTQSMGADLLTYIICHELSHRIPHTLGPSFAYKSRPQMQMLHPFLNQIVSDWALTLNLTNRIDYDGRKWWYKKVVFDLAKLRLNRKIWNRRKGIYTAPFRMWLAVPAFGEYVVQRLGDMRCLERIFPEKFLSRWSSTLVAVVAGREEASNEFARQCWIFLTYISWAKGWKL